MVLAALLAVENLEDTLLGEAELLAEQLHGQALPVLGLVPDPVVPRLANLGVADEEPLGLPWWVVFHAGVVEWAPNG